MSSLIQTFKTSTLNRLQDIAEGTKTYIVDSAKSMYQKIGSSFVGKKISHLYGSFEAHPAGQMVHRAAQKTCAIGNSILGKKLIGMTLENVAEAVAYTNIGEYLVENDTLSIISNVSSATGAIGATAGKTLAVGLSLLGAKKASEILDSRLEPTTSRNQRSLQFIKNFLVIAFVLNTMFFDKLAELGEMGGVAFGEMTMSTSIPLLCAFLVIKLFGSDEKLYDSNLLETYPVKSIESIIGTDVLKRIGMMPTTPGVNLLADLTAGSLIYNNLFLKELTKTIYDGEMLDGIPNITNDPALETLMENLDREASTTVSNTTLSYIANRLFTLVSKSLGPVLYHLANSIGQRILTSHLQNHSLTETLRSTLAENLNPHMKISKTAFNLLARYINFYFTQNQLYGSRDQNNLGNAIEWVNDEYKAIKTVAEEIKNSIEEKERELLNTALITEKLEHTLTQVSPLNSAMATPVKVVNNVVENVETLSNEILDLIARGELNLFGFSLLSNAQKPEAKAFIKNNLRSLILQASSFTPNREMIEQPLTQQEVKQFYKNINHLFCGYYQTAIGKSLFGLSNSLIQSLQKEIDRQITHSTF